MKVSMAVKRIYDAGWRRRRRRRWRRRRRRRRTLNPDKRLRLKIKRPQALLPPPPASQGGIRRSKMTNKECGRRSERRRPQRDGRLAVGRAAGGAAASNGAPREAGQKTQSTRDRNPEEFVHFLLSL